MGKFFEKMVQYLNENGIAYHLDGVNGVALNRSGDYGNWQTVLRANANESRVFSISALPSRCPEEKRVAMCEFLNRVNFRRTTGGFVLGMVDGKILYQDRFDLAGKPSIMAVISSLFDSDLAAMNYCYPGIMRIVLGNINAVEAMAYCGAHGKGRVGVEVKPENPKKGTDHDADG